MIGKRFIVKKGDLLLLFFALLVGILLTPISREAIIGFTAMLASISSIDPFSGFFISMGATLTSYLLCFLLGKGLKVGLFSKFPTKFGSTLSKGYAYLNKYGSAAICFSYFVPGPRQFLPIVLGMGSMSFYRFFGMATLGALIWTVIFYLPCFYFGELLASHYAIFLDMEGLF